MQLRKHVQRWVVAGVLLTLPAMLCAVTQAQDEAGANADAANGDVADGIEWQAPSPAVNEKAKTEQKLIMADFYADWCGYCHLQDETVYRDDRVILMTDRVVPTKVDEQDDRDLIAQFQIKSYPTTVLMSADGQEIERSVGAFQNVNDHVNWLGQALYKHSLPQMKAALEKNPQDIRLLTAMALIYSAAEHKPEVAGFLEKAGDAAIKKYEAQEKIERDKNGQAARAFRLLAMYFDSRQDYERAIPSLYYLSQLSTRPREVAAARIALAEDFYQMNQTPKAIAELEALLKTSDLTGEEKQKAHTKLSEYKKAPN
jgi:thioredoxin-like negative regulator of GroEL